jgi:hypothetical protein
VDCNHYLPGSDFLEAGDHALAAFAASASAVRHFSHVLKHLAFWTELADFELAFWSRQLDGTHVKSLPAPT